jgi:hypothetical protein
MLRDLTFGISDSGSYHLLHACGHRPIYPAIPPSPPTEAITVIAGQVQVLQDQVQDDTQTYPSQRLPEIRRLSVHSLLSGPSNLSCLTNETNSDVRIQVKSSPPHCHAESDDTTTWGCDWGLKDLDIQKNDDMDAITGSLPIYFVHLELDTEIGGFGDGHYYDKPVPITIPKSLEPLPSTLLCNPMNLLVSRFSSSVQLTLADTYLVFREFLGTNS